MTHDLWFWPFNAVVLILLLLDLFVFHRGERRVSVRSAALSTVGWMSLSLGFAAAVWFFKGHHIGMEFLAGYLIEYSLSVDNLFIFVMIFSYFKVDERHQHRVLFWGVLGAIIMRAVMIAVGVRLVTRFEWLLYVFGAFLVVTGFRMAFKSEHDVNLEKNLILRLCRRFFRISEDYHGTHLVVRRNGVLMLTPLMVVLLIIETMDLVFAVDSIPAVFAVTREPFIVYSSNICAILGLRSMYFLLAHVVDKFVYLKYGLAGVLSFIGVKMLIGHYYHVPIALSLGVVAFLLGSSIVASLLFGKNPKQTGGALTL